MFQDLNSPDPASSAVALQTLRSLWNTDELRQEFLSRVRRGFQEVFDPREQEALGESYEGNDRFWERPEGTERLTPEEYRLQARFSFLRKEVKSRLITEVAAETVRWLGVLSGEEFHNARGMLLVWAYETDSEQIRQETRRAPHINPLNLRFGTWFFKDIGAYLPAVAPEKIGWTTRTAIEQSYINALEESWERLLFPLLSARYRQSEQYLNALTDYASSVYTLEFAAKHYLHKLLARPVLKRAAESLCDRPLFQTHVLETIVSVLEQDLVCKRPYAGLLRDIFRNLHRSDLMCTSHLREVVYGDFERLCAAGKLTELNDYARLIVECTPAKSPEREIWIRLAHSFGDQVEPLIIRKLRQKKSYPGIVLRLDTLEEVFCPDIGRHEEVTKKAAYFLKRLAAGSNAPTVWTSASVLASKMPVEHLAQIVESDNLREQIHDVVAEFIAEFQPHVRDVYADMRKKLAAKTCSSMLDAWMATERLVEIVQGFAYLGSAERLIDRLRLNLPDVHALRIEFDAAFDLPAELGLWPIKRAPTS